MRKFIKFLFKKDPKEVVLYSTTDLRKHAVTLSRLNPEEKALLADYLTHAELNKRRLAQDSRYSYGISVKQALEIQKNKNHQSRFH